MVSNAHPKLVYGAKLSEIFHTGIQIVSQGLRPITDEFGNPTGQALDFSVANLVAPNGAIFEIGETKRWNSGFVVKSDIDQVSPGDEGWLHYSARDSEDLDLWFFGREFSETNGAASVSLVEIQEQRSIVMSELNRRFGYTVEPRLHSFVQHNSRIKVVY